MFWEWDWFEDSTLLTLLQGGGGTPDIAVTPSSWDFGSIPSGTAVPKVFTIQNPGTAKLTIPAINVPAGFTLVDPIVFPHTINAGGSDTFTIEADADDVDVFSGNISISNDATDTPVLIPVDAEVFFEDDFGRANGAIGNNWNGSTWNIVSGKAVNSPTLGSELLTDPGLEANYTAGKCDTLTLNGSPASITQSTDVHGGSKAQQMQPNAFNNRLNWPTAAGVARQWYQFSVWTKRLSGSNTGTRIRLFQTNMLPVNTIESPIIDASYKQLKISGLSTDTNALFRYPAVEAAGSSPFSSVVVDDGSFKAITFSSLFAMRPLASADGVIKIKFTTVDDTFFGIVARADTQTSPTNFIMALLKRHPSYSGAGLIEVHLLKKVGTTYTAVVQNLSFTEVADAWFELRLSGSTVSMWYNGAQVGTNQTISNAEILSNGYHGMFSTGDNTISDFFYGSQLNTRTLAWGGTSILVNSNSWSVRVRANTLLHSEYPEYDWSFLNAARSGHNTWSNLVRLQTEILALNPDIVIFDTANDTNESWQNAATEAYIRRILTAYPNARLAAYNFPAVSDQNTNSNINSPTNEAAILSREALYAHYGIQLLDYWGTIQDLVNNHGHNLNEYMSDTIHPDSDGHNEAYGLLLPYLPFGLSAGSGVLPARLYDDGTLENTPTRRNGNANSGETGSWSTIATTGRQSSSAGATIAFNNVTCSTIGAYRADGGSNANLEISVDGGAYYNFTLYQNGGQLNEGLGTHNIIIRLKTGGTCRIDEFWAV